MSYHSELDARTYGPYEAEARGYAWGRLDMGDKRCVDVQAFAEAFANRRRAFDAQETHWMPALQDAYEAWLAWGRIPLHGWIPPSR